MIKFKSILLIVGIWLVIDIWLVDMTKGIIPSDNLRLGLGIGFIVLAYLLNGKKLKMKG